MTVPTQLPLTLTSFNNNALFSDHYLDDILRGDNAWREAIPQAQAFLAWLRDLYAQEKDQLAGYNEAQLEGKWFEPIFERLGHVWQEQAIIPAFKGGIKKPDYVFFPDEDARKTAVSLQNSTEYVNAALAIGEVKQWGISLDKNQRGAALFDNKNPMYQIDSYLSLTGVEWGVLSDGRFWRLLHKSSSRTLETYFEIDLCAMLETADEKKATATAIYFWLFFNQASYKPDAHGRIFLTHALDQSRAYALALEADLRDNAYRALEQLILGFFAANPSLNADEPTHLADVYRNSLYLLYRLLFLFYGESRALLPMDNAVYKDDYSLQRLSKKIDRWRNEHDTLPATGRVYWCELSELFRIISGVDVQLNADLGVSRYNGGLFDPQQHRFLEEHVVGDRYIARAIDYLAVRRVMDSGGKPAFHAVDYRTLDVRQLGSIYEGLLEYKVAIAREEMVTVSKKGVETWVALAQKGRAKTFGNRRQIGELYLTTDKGERKATGSYYTPDYIVEYIVENTLSPLVAGAEARAMGDGDRFIAEILALNVLDPAMGSGHFLVEATNYLARVLVVGSQARSQAFTKSGTSMSPESPRSQAFTEGETSDFDKSLISESPDSDLLYWKRRVVEACIYGVDKNPMAVELAKLSLWLKTAAADKPLSFLDHHLQHGDSLIGATLEDLQGGAGARAQGSGGDEGQKPLFDESAFTRDVGLAVGGVMAIEGMLTETIDDVHTKEEIWAGLQKTHIGDWRRLADLWVSIFFGNSMSREEYRALADRLQGRDSLMSDAQAERLLNHPAVMDNDYFHWQFMFPEVFFDKHGKPLKEAAGFDAVVGNPPWVNIGRESGNEQIVYFLKYTFTSAEYQIDLYSLFLELSTVLSRNNAYMGMIVPDPWLANYRTPKLRELLLIDNQMIQILHTSRSAFPDVGAEHLILLLQHTDRKNEYFGKGFLDTNGVANITDRFPLSLINKQNNFVVFTNSHSASIIQKVENISTNLGAEFETIRGIGPYHHRSQPKEIIKERAYHADYQKDETFVPILQGTHLERYAIQWGGDSWISYGSWLAEPRERRFFQGKRLLLREIIGDKFLTDVLDEEFIVDRGIYIALQGDRIIDLSYVLTLFASKLLIFWFREKFNENDELFPKLRVAHFNMLPVRTIDFTTPEPQRTAVSQQSQALYQQADHPALLTLVTAELAAGRNDTIHDLLAFLAEEMIRLNKEKQTEVNGFLDWLADYTELPVNEWKLKTIARAYYTKGWEEFRRALKQNKRKITAVDVNGRIPLNKLKGEYEASVLTLTPLLATVQATDRLIDQIVYQLYGLTDEEIAIVEA